MKTLIPILLVLILASCQKEEVLPILTNEFSINSTATGATYPIKVALPQDYNPATHTYATIYVLDGEENFSFVAENCEKISHELSAANVLVVSIGYVMTGLLITHRPTPMKAMAAPNSLCSF